MPAGAAKSEAKSVIATVNGSVLTTGSGVTLNVLDCSSISYNRTSKVFKVGDRIEWKGWKAGTSVNVIKATLN